MTNHYAGPFPAPGDPASAELTLARQARMRDDDGPYEAREAVRRQLEADGTIEKAVQSMIDERMKENENDR